MIKQITADQTLHFESHGMKQLMEKVTAISATDYTVLITGESGSGKEYVARIIHRLSKRKAKSCHALNCPAIPETLLESELFGHVKGSFTGAERNREGFFMSADKGTLILDEIGNIPVLVREFILKTCYELGISAIDIDPSALSYISRQPWQGNIRGDETHPTQFNNV